MTPRTLASGLLALAATATQAATGPSQATAPLPGGFATACASQISSGVTYTPGRELQSAFDFWPGQASCNSQVFSALGSASASADWTSAKVQNHSSVQASLGAIHLATGNVAPKNIQFPVAVAGGGWNDTVTVTDGQAGQTGIWYFQMAVDGSFTTGGGASRVELNAYKNKVELSRSVAGFDRGDSDAFTTDAQRVMWRSGNEATRSVSDLITSGSTPRPSRAWAATRGPTRAPTGAASPTAAWPWGPRPRRRALAPGRRGCRRTPERAGRAGPPRGRAGPGSAIAGRRGAGRPRAGRAA